MPRAPAAPSEPAWGPGWQAYVYERANPRGPHQEYWHHVAGCRQWLVVSRDTLSHEVQASALAEPTEFGDNS